MVEEVKKFCPACAQPLVVRTNEAVGESHLRCLGPLTHHAERWFCELDWMVGGIRE